MVRLSTRSGREPEAEGPSRRRRSGRRRWAENGLIVILAVGVAVLMRAFVAQAYWIPSASMVPQLRVNDRVVVSRLAYHLHPVHRGDIVVFNAPPGLEVGTRTPSDPLLRVAHDLGVALGFAQDQTVLIKRVIGLPGDTVAARDGRVYVNGQLLDEPYLPKGTVTSSFGPVAVPPGHVWVMGDNRPDSEDSRVFGAVPTSTIVGRAVWKVWPLWHTSFL